MKLRTKLIVLQVSVVVILTVIICALVLSLFRSAIPLLERGVATKARACLHALLSEADVGLAAEDQQTLRALLPRCDYGGARDVDLRFAAIVDRQGRLLASVGSVPPGLRAEARQREQAAHVAPVPHGVRGHASVAIEGRYLGAVLVEYSTARIEAWRRYYFAFSVVAVALVLLSGVASVFFAVHLIQPLRRMIEYVHEVAAGNLEGKLQTRASDEMGQLADDLNAMTVRLRETRQLVANASRHAGMAEVATNVLHNVGNVLNSVNVSCEVIGETLRGSKVDSLAKVSAMLEGRSAEELATLLTTDEQGRQLPRFIAVLAEHLASERAGLLEEVDGLRRNIDHIKTIVSTQQQYSRAGGQRELTRLEEIVETALQIITSSTARHQIRIERALEELPPVTVDRHKLLQILINLLSNARDALRGCERDDRRLRISLKRHEPDRVRIEITDNGMGVAPENLARIFQHGFSTKKDGNGFGLHASANNAQEMDGALTCRSDGLGQGATFVLDLPFPVEPARGGAGAADRAEVALVANAAQGAVR